MENKNNIIEKPKIRVIKKAIKKRPPANIPNTTELNNINDLKELDEKISKLNIKDNNNNSSNNSNSNNSSIIKGKPQVLDKAEILKKTIKEKVHFDKLTFEAQMYLTENEATEDELKNHYYNLLQDNHYKDIVIERSAALKCGYPCCDKTIDNKKKLNQKYTISIKDQKVYNVEELSMYHSSDCLVKSKLYESTLDPTAVYLRKVNGSSKIPSSTTNSDSNNNDSNKESEVNNVFNSFEKSLKITENENASLQPPDTNYGNTGDTSTFSDKFIKGNKQPKQQEKREEKKEEIKPVINNKQPLQTLQPQQKEIKPKIKTIEKKKIKIIEPNNIPIVNDIYKIKDSDDDEDSNNEDDLFDYDNNEEYNEDEIPIITRGDSDDDDEEGEEEEEEGDIETKSDITIESSDDEFSLFRPNQLAAKKYKDLYKPSNYHTIYSALSQFTTKHTNIFIQTNQVNYEYILEQNLEIKTSLHTQLNLIYPIVLEQLKFKNTTGKEKVIMLIDTFRFDKSIPSLKRNQWKMMILVFLKALSKNDKDLEKDIKDNFENFTNLVKECSFDLDTLKVFEDLLTLGYE